MTDVILIEPPYWERKKKPREQPQLGLAYIASYLEKNNHSVKIIDASLEDLSPGQIAEQVASDGARIVGITGCTDDRFGIIKIIESIRNRCGEDTLIVGGGPHFSYTAEDALTNIPALDVVAIGQGEITMVELVAGFRSPKEDIDYADIRGIVYRENGQVVFTPQREIIDDLNEMPGPAWHLFDMEKYQGIMSAGAPFRAIGVVSSRGCPFSCSFCANSLSKKFKYLEPSVFVDEIEFLMEKYGFEAFNFQDDSFMANRRHAESICNEIISRNLDIKWYCSLRVDRASKDKELLRLMKKAGCIALGFGVEFPSDDVLKHVSKNTTVTMIEAAMRNVKELEFPYVSLFLITSLPGQTRENTVQAQLNLNRYHEILYGEYPYSVFRGALARLYPGTELTSVAQNQGLLDEDFQWNAYYKNPNAEKYNDWLIGCWSVPNYETRDLSIEDIDRVLKRIQVKLYLRRVREKKMIGPLVKSLFSPAKWKHVMQAAGVRRAR